MTDYEGATATIDLKDLPGEEGFAEVTVAVTPPELADSADYINITSWQGAEWREGVHGFADELEQVSPGIYRSTRPIPTTGEWKSLVRLHRDRVMLSAPIFLPADDGIPVDEVPAEPSATRDFVLGQELLLREARPAAAWITILAYVLTLGVIVVWIGGIGWGVRRLRNAAAQTPRRRPRGTGRPQSSTA